MNPPTYMSPEIDAADFVASASRAAESCSGLDLAAQARRLAGDGLLGILAAEDVGGLGLTLGYALPILEATAPSLLAFPLAETMLLARAVEASDPALAASLCDGRATATIAWRSDALLGSDGRLAGRARAPFAREVDWLLVPTTDGRAALVEHSALGAQPSTPDAFDPSRPQAVVSLDGVQVGQDRILGDEAVRIVREDALLLRAALIAGSAAFCVDLAVAHAGTRQQFGKPLVANQAVRHALARQKLSLESMKAALRRAASLDRHPAATLARLAAFAAAAQGGPAIAESAVQVHGGMGYTWEVPVHRHLRRIRALAAEADAPARSDDLAAAFMDGVAAA